MVNANAGVNRLRSNNVATTDTDAAGAEIVMYHAHASAMITAQTGETTTDVTSRATVMTDVRVASLMRTTIAEAEADHRRRLADATPDTQAPRERSITWDL